MVKDVRAIHLERCRECGKPCSVEAEKAGFRHACLTCKLSTTPQPSARASADKWNAWEDGGYMNMECIDQTIELAEKWLERFKGELAVLNSQEAYVRDDAYRGNITPERSRLMVRVKLFERLAIDLESMVYFIDREEAEHV